MSRKARCLVRLSEQLMSALGQKRTSEHVQSMSALPPKEDIACSRDVNILAARTKLIISSLCRYSSYGTHLLARGKKVRVLVCNVFVSFQACRIGKLTLP